MPIIKIQPEEIIPVVVDRTVKVKVNDAPLRVNISDPSRQVYEFKIKLRRALEVIYSSPLKTFSSVLNPD